MAIDEALIQGAGAVNLIVPELEFDVGEPGLKVRHPGHPPLEDLAGAGDITKHLLHVNVLVPKLVDAGEERDGAVPDIAGVVDEPVTHLELGVLEPEGVVAVVVGDGALPDGAGAGKVLLRFFPLGILDPDGGVPADAADEVFEFLALAEAVVGELGRVGDLLLGGADLGFLALAGLAEDLLGGDLDGGGGFVLDAGGAGEFDFCVFAGEEP